MEPATAGQRPIVTDGPTGVGLTRRRLTEEVGLVLALSLGASALLALVRFLADLSSGRPLSAQTAGLNGSLAPGRPWLDLVLQLIDLGLGIVPVLLVAHLLAREGSSLARLAVGRSGIGLDLVRGFVVAAVVGRAGLMLYLASHAAGTNLTVVPESLPATWWRVPILIASAAQNALLEECLLLGYLLRRLDQLGWSPGRAAGFSAALRGCYHLYQGLGGCLGNAILGLIFVWCYRRWGRFGPLVVAHTVIDAVAFLGYLALAGRVSWLPTPP